MSESLYTTSSFILPVLKGANPTILLFLIIFVEKHPKNVDLHSFLCF